jgi:hypothetical protein
MPVMNNARAKACQPNAIRKAVEEVPMRKLVVAIALLAVSSAHAHAARATHHAAKKPVRQAVHSERRVVHKAKNITPTDEPSAPASPAMKLPYDAFRA